MTSTEDAVIHLDYYGTMLSIRIEDIPDKIKECGLDFEIDVPKLWSLSAPVVDVPIDELRWHLHYPFWPKNGILFSLQPMEVLDSPHNHELQYSKILSSQLDYSIDVVPYRGRLLILDGLHRLCKAHLLQLQHLPCRMHELDSLSNIAI